MHIYIRQAYTFLDISDSKVISKSFQKIIEKKRGTTYSLLILRILLMRVLLNSRKSRTVCDMSRGHTYPTLCNAFFILCNAYLTLSVT